jgi:hypothetical protein
MVGWYDKVYTAKDKEQSSAPIILYHKMGKRAAF